MLLAMSGVLFSTEASPHCASSSTRAYQISKLSGEVICIVSDSDSACAVCSFGMGVLACGPGKPFYGFGSLFCYMVFLGLYHGLLVLPVVLSVLNPKSIAEAFEMNLTVEVDDEVPKIVLPFSRTGQNVCLYSSNLDCRHCRWLKARTRCK
eukprot:SAG31_NODE_722_length_12572_cov_2.409124_11_plen_151_part_00